MTTGVTSLPSIDGETMLAPAAIVSVNDDRYLQRCRTDVVVSTMPDLRLIVSIDECVSPEIRALADRASAITHAQSDSSLGDRRGAGTAQGEIRAAFRT